MVLLLYQYTKCEMNSKAFLLVDTKLSEKKVEGIFIVMLETVSSTMNILTANKNDFA